MRNYVILLVLLLILNGSCASHSSQQPKGSGLVKLTGQINEMLHEIETNPARFMMGSFSGSSNLEDHKEGIAKNCRLLIENPDIALPLMFKRLDNKKLDTWLSALYFIVFEKTRSAESVPYIADYLASGSEEELQQYTIGNVVNGPGAALSAARQITSLKLVEGKHNFFDERKEIAERLRQWYQDYKKAQE